MPFDAGSISGTVSLDRKPAAEALRGTVKEAQKMRDDVGKAMDETAARGVKSYDNMLKGIKGELGRHSELGETLHLLAGGGAVIGLSMAGSELKTMTAGLADFHKKLETGAADPGEMYDSLIGSIPVLGNFYSAAQSLRDVFDPEAIGLRAMKAELEASEAHLEMMVKHGAALRSVFGELKASTRGSLNAAALSGIDVSSERERTQADQAFDAKVRELQEGKNARLQALQGTNLKPLQAEFHKLDRQRQELEEMKKQIDESKKGPGVLGGALDWAFPPGPTIGDAIKYKLAKSTWESIEPHYNEVQGLLDSALANDVKEQKRLEKETNAAIEAARGEHRARLAQIDREIAQSRVEFARKAQNELKDLEAETLTLRTQVNSDKYVGGIMGGDAGVRRQQRENLDALHKYLKGTGDITTGSEGQEVWSKYGMKQLGVVQQLNEQLEKNLKLRNQLNNEEWAEQFDTPLEQYRKALQEIGERKTVGGLSGQAADRAITQAQRDLLSAERGPAYRRPEVSAQRFQFGALSTPAIAGQDAVMGIQQKQLDKQEEIRKAIEDGNKLKSQTPRVVSIAA